MTCVPDPPRTIGDCVVPVTSKRAVGGVESNVTAKILWLIRQVAMSTHKATQYRILNSYIFLCIF